MENLLFFGVPILKRIAVDRYVIHVTLACVCFIIEACRDSTYPVEIGTL